MDIMKIRQKILQKMRKKFVKVVEILIIPAIFAILSKIIPKFVTFCQKKSLIAFKKKTTVINFFVICLFFIQKIWFSQNFEGNVKTCGSAQTLKLWRLHWLSKNPIYLEFTIPLWILGFISKYNQLDSSVHFKFLNLMITNHPHIMRISWKKERNLSHLMKEIKCTSYLCWVIIVSETTVLIGEFIVYRRRLPGQTIH